MAEEITAIQHRRRFRPQEIATIVKQLREFRLWSTESLASEARVNPRAIERLEHAQSVTDVRRLEAIAQALGFPEHFFTDPVDLPDSYALRSIIERAKNKLSAGMPKFSYLPGIGQRAVDVRPFCME